MCLPILKRIIFLNSPSHFLLSLQGSGSTLNDQVLTSDNIPVIVDRCITHVEVHGLNEKGVYRTAGQSSRVQALLDDFRKGASLCGHKFHM